jgi:putative ABC transport system permease protein
MESFSLFLKVAFRNMLKYKRRTMLVMLIIFVITFLVLVYSGFISGIFDDMMRNSFYESSHGKIYYKGFYEKKEIFPLELSIRDYQSVVREIKSLYPSCVLVPEISVPTTFTYSSKTVNGLLTGSPIYIDGSLVDKYKLIKDKMIEGDLPNAGERGLVISSKMAKSLGVKVGDRVIILTTDVYGSFNAVEVEVKGIYKSPKNEGIVDLASAQNLLGLEGRATEILVYLPSHHETKKFSDAVGEVLKKYNLEFFDWKEILGIIAMTLDLTWVFNLVLYLIIGSIAVVGIMNSVLLSIFDRIRDVGTLRAIGMRRSEVFGMFIFEFGLQGGLASLVGVVLGGVVLYILSIYGVPLPAEYESYVNEFGISLVLKPALKFTDVLFSLLLGVGISVLSTIYPLMVVRKMTVKELLSF